MMKYHYVRIEAPAKTSTGIGSVTYNAEAFDRFVMGVHLDVLPSILGQPAFFVAESFGVRGGSFGEWGLFVLNSLLWGAMIALVRRMFRRVRG